jgi:hypothetical protein
LAKSFPRTPFKKLLTKGAVHSRNVRGKGECKMTSAVKYLATRGAVPPFSKKLITKKNNSLLNLFINLKLSKNELFHVCQTVNFHFFIGIRSSILFD